MVRKAFSFLLTLAFVLAVFFAWHERNYLLSYKKAPAAERVASLSSPGKPVDVEIVDLPGPENPEPVKKPEPAGVQQAQPAQPKQEKPAPQPVSQPTQQKQQPEPEHRLKITGDKEYVEIIEGALGLIKHVSPLHYDFIEKHFDEIRQVDRGSRIEVTGPVIFYNRLDKDYFPGDYQRLIVHEAGQIVHESVHVALYLSGQPYSGEQAERMALEAQNAFLWNTGYKELRYDVEKQLQTRWWEVPYSQRWW